MTVDKTIFRVTKDRENPFAMIDRRVLENPDLSWKAKGLLGYLLSRPDNWTIYMGDLVKRSTDGEHSTRSAVDELIATGHIVRKVEREKGRFVNFILEVYEQPVKPDTKPLCENHEMASPFGGFPQVENPQVENPQVENPFVENRTINDIELNKTKGNENMGAQSPARSQQEKKGDVLDGILFFAQAASDPAQALKARISEYPADIQDTLQSLAEIYAWPAASIPERPARGGKGGHYAQWINETRQINQIIIGHGRVALEATKTPCKNISISHPGAILWCLPGEVGKLSQARARQELFNLPEEEIKPSAPPEDLRRKAYASLGVILP